MKLKEKRLRQIISGIRDVLMESETGIRTYINIAWFSQLDAKFSEGEVRDALRYLQDKGYLDTRRTDGAYVLASKGYDEWLFPFGVVIPNSVFISYADEDKKLAQQLKDHIDSAGLKGFLAHEDIEPTAKWRDRIISDLSSCSIFLALVTLDFVKQQYTEQECGFALALNKRILCVGVGVGASQLGFCSEYQAMLYASKKDIKKIFRDIVLQLRKLPG